MMLTVKQWEKITPRLTDDEHPGDYRRRVYDEWRDAVLEEAQRRLDYEPRGEEQAIQLLIDLLRERPPT